MRYAWKWFLNWLFGPMSDQALLRAVAINELRKRNPKMSAKQAGILIDRAIRSRDLD